VFWLFLAGLQTAPELKETIILSPLSFADQNFMQLLAGQFCFPT
jgi:hypothetical protein